MALTLTRFIRPKTLTDCVFDNSVSGRLSHLYWLYGINAGRSLKQKGRDVPDPDVEATISQLSERGLVVTSANTFLSPSGRAALDAAEAMIRKECESEAVQEMVGQGKNPERSKDYLIQIVSFTDVLDADNPLVKLALDPKILECVAGYMGMWPMLHAVGSWLNFPTFQEAKYSQLWHRDPEDLKTLKVFIYLDAVGPENGPFTYIPKTQPFGVDCRIEPQHEHARRVLDGEMDRALPEDRWVKCTGAARTMIMADTVGFHRGGNVQEGSRLLITFTYTSGKPQQARKLSVTGKPSWAPTPLQLSALSS